MPSWLSTLIAWSVVIFLLAMNFGFNTIIIVFNFIKFLLN